MSIKGKGVLLAVSALGVILAGAGPALAQGHSGGGGGGGHSSGGGGGHSMGGGHASGGHVGGGGGHFAGPGHFAGGGHVAMGYHGGAVAGRGAGYVGHSGYVGNHGYSTGWHGGGWNGGWRGGGWGGWRGGAWRGGYWHGGFWPRAYYGVGFAWFLPILPLAYATYWYGGVPYYYADDVYYTWNPTYDGYVVTDPPPVGDASGSADVAAPAPEPGDAGAQTGPGPGGPIPGQIFMYPKNGQSAEQQASDKAECQRWASEQAGQVAQNGSDYNRAMVACVEGRGYSAR